MISLVIGSHVGTDGQRPNSTVVRASDALLTLFIPGTMVASVATDVLPLNSYSTAIMGAITTKIVVVLELGAFHMQASYKEVGDCLWRDVLWRDSSPSDMVSETRVLPAIAAVRRSDKVVVKFGYDAKNAQLGAPQEWAFYYHLKSHLIRQKELPKNLQMQRHEDDKTAKELGITCKDLAISQFNWVFERIVERYGKAVKLLVNITDAWPCEVAEDLLKVFRNSLPDVNIQPVDECLCSVLGASASMRRDTQETYVVVDCGTSTIVSAATK